MVPGRRHRLQGPGDLATALQIVEEDGLPLGVHLNRTKSLLHYPSRGHLHSEPPPTRHTHYQEWFHAPGRPCWPPLLLQDNIAEQN